MPLYEYKCAKCGHRFEKIQKHTASHKQKCPMCGGRSERLLAPPAIQFKGSGWYVTDYARKSRPSAEKPHEKGEAKESSHAKEEKKSPKED